MGKLFPNSIFQTEKRKSANAGALFTIYIPKGDRAQALDTFDTVPPR